MHIVEECGTCDYWGNIRSKCYLCPGTPVTKTSIDHCSKWKMRLVEGTLTTASYPDTDVSKEEWNAYAQGVEELIEGLTNPVVTPSLTLHVFFTVLGIGLLLFLIVPFVVGLVVIVQWGLS